jgi:hypothetical protein
MSTSVVLGLFTAVSVAAIVCIMGAAIWARSRSNREDLEPTTEYGEGGHGLFAEHDHQYAPTAADR